LKDDIESTTPAKFDNDIIRYNTWFEDTREAIIEEEEGLGYNEYLRSLFRAYLTCNEDEFLDAIKDEHKDWIQGKVAPQYSYRNLMDLGRVMYNNLVDEGTYRHNNPAPQPKDKEEDKNYLALAAALMTNMSGLNDSGNKGGSKGSTITYQPWRFENPDNEDTKVVRGSTMKWCKNDCHKNSMWCGRKNCLNRADFHENWKKKNASKASGSDSNIGNKPKGSTKSSEFKIKLAAMTSLEDFAALKEQFVSLKD